MKTTTQRTRKASTKLPWPTPLPERVQAVRGLLAVEPGPFRPGDLAARFRRANAEQMTPLLETLAVLGLVHRTDDGAFTA